MDYYIYCQYESDTCDYYIDGECNKGSSKCPWEELENKDKMEVITMKEKLRQLFYENYKPCATPQILGLGEKFILKNGFTKDVIKELVVEGFIEKVTDGYRMTKEALKEFMDENSWAYRTFVMEN